MGKNFSVDQDRTAASLADAIIEMSNSLDRFDNYPKLCGVLEAYLEAGQERTLELTALESHAKIGEEKLHSLSAQTEDEPGARPLFVLGGQGDLLDPSVGEEFQAFYQRIFPDDLRRFKNWCIDTEQRARNKFLLFRVYEDGRSSLSLYILAARNSQLEILPVGHFFSFEIEEAIRLNFQLSSSEMLVVRGLMHNLSLNDIAHETGKARNTIRSQLKSIARKIGVSSQGELTNALHNLQRHQQAGSLSEGGTAPRGALLLHLEDRVIVYNIFGDPEGEPLLFVHDFSGGRHWSARAQAQFAKAGYKLISYSRAGFSVSDPVDLTGIPLLKSHGEDCRRVMDALGIERCKLLAFGTGFSVAYHFSLMYPDRVDRIIGANIYPPILSHRDTKLFPPGLYRAGITAALYAPATHRFVSKIAVKRIKSVETHGDLDSVVGLETFEIAERQMIFDEAIKPNLDDMALAEGDGAWRDVTFVVKDWLRSTERLNTRAETVLLQHADFPFFNGAHVEKFAREQNFSFRRLPHRYRGGFIDVDPLLTHIRRTVAV